MFTAINYIAVRAYSMRASGLKHIQKIMTNTILHGALMGRCDTVRVGASNTTKQAGNLPDSEVFSRQEFLNAGFSRIQGFGRDGVNRKATRSTCFEFETSRPPVARSNAASGYQSRQGASTMTKVNTPTTSNADTTDGAVIARHAAIENALSMALFHIRQPHSHQALQAATGRAIRAASMLKQACTEASGVTA